MYLTQVPAVDFCKWVSEWKIHFKKATLFTKEIYSVLTIYKVHISNKWKHPGKQQELLVSGKGGIRCVKVGMEEG